MINPVSQINTINPISNISDNNTVNSFSGLLQSAMNEVNNLQIQSQVNDKKLVTGEIDNLHNVMIDATKADIALQFTIQIKNKILDAYQEIMKMPV
ncbi:MAG: flagellar hook-basal body complex protein FliE [Thermoanaerobacteraceae bacterium]|jgi:flagellar hook-basal body complex protein FliE|nr:flagellar hook-basal body complex protein FliE [Thermoanaerobacteraceae bacterium]